MTTPTHQTFETILQREGKFTFVALPFPPVQAWGARPRFAVTGTINGHAVRGTLGAQEEAYFLRVGAAWLRDSGLSAGDPVVVTLELEGPQDANLAADIRQALDAHPAAKTFFDGLPTFYRKNYIRWIESAKRDDTRARRIAEMVQLLAEGKREK
ncbi:MAG: DUF1905 domain-containing protein [Anaerolineae bacterium]|nr:DUF1905 domain-containing protein [Anaerolineae bacterium]